MKIAKITTDARRLGQKRVDFLNKEVFEFTINAPMSKDRIIIWFKETKDSLIVTNFQEKLSVLVFKDSILYTLQIVKHNYIHVTASLRFHSYFTGVRLRRYYSVIFGLESEL